MRVCESTVMVVALAGVAAVSNDLELVGPGLLGYVQLPIVAAGESFNAVELRSVHARINRKVPRVGDVVFSFLSSPRILTEANRIIGASRQRCLAFIFPCIKYSRRASPVFLIADNIGDLRPAQGVSIVVLSEIDFGSVRNPESVRVLRAQGFPRAATLPQQSVPAGP